MRITDEDIFSKAKRTSADIVAQYQLCPNGEIRGRHTNKKTDISRFFYEQQS